MYVIGSSMIFGAVFFEVRPRWLGVFLFLLGFLLIFIGGFSARAQLAGLWVFGEPGWKKAKRTYKNNNENTQEAFAENPDEDKG